MTKVVRCRNVFGELKEIELTDQGKFDAPGSRLENRIVVANNQTFVYKCVPPALGARSPGLYGLLDNEIRAGTRLGQAYAERYPRELASLVAYDVDAEEPFALLRAYLGAPAGDHVGGFDETVRRQFEVGLLTALWFTAEADVVHGAVTMDALRWDGRQLQLVNFECAQQAGDRRYGAAATRSPDSGKVDKRDDMGAAAMLIRELTMGSHQTAFGGGHEPERLRSLLTPVFGSPPEHWPHPGDLLRALRVAPPVITPVDPAHGLVAGRRQFDVVSNRKRQGSVSHAARPPAAPEAPPRFSKTALVVVVALLLVVAWGLVSVLT